MDDLELVGLVHETADRCKSNTHRLDKLEQQQETLNRLVTSVEVLATNQGHMQESLKNIQDDVDGMKEKPGKRWDSIVETIIKTVLAALVGFLIAQVGLG